MPLTQQALALLLDDQETGQEHIQLLYELAADNNNNPFLMLYNNYAQLRQEVLQGEQLSSLRVTDPEINPEKIFNAWLIQFYAYLICFIELKDFYQNNHERLAEKLNDFDVSTCRDIQLRMFVELAVEELEPDENTAESNPIEINSSDDESAEESELAPEERAELIVNFFKAIRQMAHQKYQEFAENPLQATTSMLCNPASMLTGIDMSAAAGGMLAMTWLQRLAFHNLNQTFLSVITSSDQQAFMIAEAFGDLADQVLAEYMPVVQIARQRTEFFKAIVQDLTNEDKELNVSKICDEWLEKTASLALLPINVPSAVGIFSKFKQGIDTAELEIEQNKQGIANNVLEKAMSILTADAAHIFMQELVTKFIYIEQFSSLPMICTVCGFEICNEIHRQKILQGLSNVFGVAQAPAILEQVLAIQAKNVELAQRYKDAPQANQSLRLS